MTTTAFAGMPDEGLAFLEDLDSLWCCGGRLEGGVQQGQDPLPER
jgi:hypothetical protein